MAGGDLQKLVADLMQAACPRLPEFKKAILKSFLSESQCHHPRKRVIQ
jgi:hypothetical protein